jgi:hypothetical protein
MRIWTVVLVLWCLPQLAGAHDRTMSYSTWRIGDGQARVTLTLSELDVAGLPLGVGEDALPRYVASHLELFLAGKPSAVLEVPRRVPAPAGRFRLEWSVIAPVDAAFEIRSDLFHESRPGHLHFATLQHAAGSIERVLTSADRSWLIEPNRSATQVAESSGFGDYIALGIEHILTGYDHLVFLFALLLAGGSFRDVVKVVTGFTVGHSITLALAVLGFVRPQIEPIEALIGLSIAVIAVENVWLRARHDIVLPGTLLAVLVLLGTAATVGLGRIPALCWIGLAIFLACHYLLLKRGAQTAMARWPVAMLFGLVHGFGFASALLESGLPTDRMASALVGFNLGVEAGQLALVAMVWPMLTRAMRWRPTALVQSGSAACLSLGVFWMVGRNYA